MTGLAGESHEGSTEVNLVVVVRVVVAVVVVVGSMVVRKASASRTRDPGIAPCFPKVKSVGVLSIGTPSAVLAWCLMFYSHHQNWSAWCQYALVWWDPQVLSQQNST